VESHIIILLSSSPLARSPFLRTTTAFISHVCPLRVIEVQNEVVGPLVVVDVVVVDVVVVDVVDDDVVIVVVITVLVLVLNVDVDVDLVDEGGRLEHLQMGKPSSKVHSLYLK
jgi:hypothetical protein